MAEVLINLPATFTSTVKIQGGSPGTGKVLQSDANGNGSWVDPALTAIVYAVALG